MASKKISMKQLSKGEREVIREFIEHVSEQIDTLEAILNPSKKQRREWEEHLAILKRILKGTKRDMKYPKGGK